MSVSPQAQELHDVALVIDTHNDTIVGHIRRGGVSLSSEDEKSGVPEGTVDHLRERFRGEAAKVRIQINFPKMRQGGIDAAFFAVDCTSARNNHLAYSLDALGTLHAQIEAADDVILATSAAHIRQAKQEGKLAVVMVIENSDGVEGSLNILRSLHHVGVRSIGLTHNTSSWAADGNAEARSRGGLTTFGVSLIREMDHLGMLIDVSHISQPGFWDVIDTTGKPIIASHSTCTSICDHPRNLTDDQIKAIDQGGGVIGMTFVPHFVASENPTLGHFLDHIDHAVQLVGPQVVGIGSDFDGGGDLMEDATHFPDITQGLLERGYSEPDIRGILGENPPPRLQSRLRLMPFLLSLVNGQWSLVSPVTGQCLWNLS